MNCKQYYLSSINTLIDKQIVHMFYNKLYKIYLDLTVNKLCS